MFVIYRTYYFCCICRLHISTSRHSLLTFTSLFFTIIFDKNKNRSNLKKHFTVTMVFLYSKIISPILCCILLSSSACVHAHETHLHEDVRTFEDMVAGLDTNIAALASECTDNDDVKSSPHMNIRAASLPLCNSKVDPAVKAAMGLGVLALDAATGGVASPIVSIVQAAYTMFCPRVFKPPQTGQIERAVALAKMVVKKELMKQITSDVKSLARTASAYADSSVKMPRSTMRNLAEGHAAEANNAAQLGLLGVHLWANNAGLALNYLENFLAEQRKRGDRPCINYATSLRKFYVDSFIDDYEGMLSDYNNYKNVETPLKWRNKNSWMCFPTSGGFDMYTEWEAYFFTREGGGNRACARSYHKGAFVGCINTTTEAKRKWTACKSDFFRNIYDTNFNKAVQDFYAKLLEVQKRLNPPAPAPAPTKSDLCGPCRRWSDCRSGLNCENGKCDMPHFPGEPGFC